MPIYKEEGKKDGKQRYRVRINYTDASGKARQIDRIAYGATEAKTLERVLTAEIKEAPPPSAKKTVATLMELRPPFSAIFPSFFVFIIYSIFRIINAFSYKFINLGFTSKLQNFKLFV